MYATVKELTRCCYFHQDEMLIHNKFTSHYEQKHLPGPIYIHVHYLQNGSTNNIRSLGHSVTLSSQLFCQDTNKFKFIITVDLKHDLN